MGKAPAKTQFTLSLGEELWVNCETETVVNSNRTGEPTGANGDTTQRNAALGCATLTAGSIKTEPQIDQKYTGEVGMPGHHGQPVCEGL